MSAPVTCAEALRLARAVLEDDKRATPGPWYVGGTGGSDPHFRREVRRPDGSSVVWCGTFPEAEAHVNAKAIAAARTREPALARWVERVMTSTPSAPIDAVLRAEYQPERPGCVTMGDRLMLPVTARAIAAALLRAADDAEAAK